MKNTFKFCYDLKTAPDIPDSVTDVVNTFYSCSSLTGTLKVYANLTTLSGCLTLAATNDGCALVLEGPNQDVLNNLLATASSGSNITIKQ